MCSGSKTKLLIIGTKELRKSRLESQNKKLNVTVAGHRVEESDSEKLLGLIINNTMTWYHHLHGNDEHKGLLSKLSQRAGLIRKLSFLMPSHRLRTISNGIFFSLLSYGLQVYGSVSGLVLYTEGPGRYQALNRDDSHKIQRVYEHCPLCPNKTWSRHSSKAFVRKKWFPLLSSDVCSLHHQNYPANNSKERTS